MEPGRDVPLHNGLNLWGSFSFKTHYRQCPEHENKTGLLFIVPYHHVKITLLHIISDWPKKQKIKTEGIISN